MHSKRHNQNWEVLAITRSVAEVGVAEGFIWQKPIFTFVIMS